MKYFVKILEAIISCFEQRYGNRYFDLLLTSVNVNSEEGDRIVFDICRILNCNVWPQLIDNSSTEIVYFVQRAALVKVFDQYKAI